jgi:hypothetical protein
VTVPFAGELAIELGRSPQSARVRRDFSRLLALIKTVAVLRHVQRTRDANGRLLAEIADYDTVRDLVAEMYSATATEGATNEVRAVVAAVRALRSVAPDTQRVSVTDVAEALAIPKSSASRRVKIALAKGWLANREWVKGRRADLALDEPMPELVILPILRRIDGTEGFAVVHSAPQTDEKCSTVPRNPEGYVRAVCDEEGDADVAL